MKESNDNSIAKAVLIIAFVILVIGGYFLYTKKFAKNEVNNKGGDKDASGCPYEEVDLKEISESDIKELKILLDENLNTNVNEDTISLSNINESDYVYELSYEDNKEDENSIACTWKEEGNWQISFSAAGCSTVASGKNCK